MTNKRTIKKILGIMSLAMIFSYTVTASGFALEARVLDDSELDGVHAGGLNVNFDNIVTALATPTAPVAPQSPGGVNSPGEPAPPAGDIALPAQPVNPVSPATPAEPVSPVDPVGPVAPNNPTPVAQTPTAPSSPSAPNAPFEPTAPTAPSAPDAPNAPQGPLSLDVLAGSDNGKFSVAVNGNSSSNGRPLFTMTNPGGALNSLTVADTAQQSLSALVNVNAAGSIVPIQLNVTVLMNSTIEHLNNNNTLDLSSFTTFQVPI